MRLKPKKRGIGLRRNYTGSKFLLDTNVFIAAVKRGWTDTTELLLHFLTSKRYTLVANDVLMAEYRKYAEKLNALDFYDFIRRRVTIVNPSREEVLRVLPYFPETQLADAVHAATCLKSGAILVTNEGHFEKVSRAGIIEVWSISRAIKTLLGGD